jgi:hypothetical protein
LREQCPSSRLRRQSGPLPRGCRTRPPPGKLGPPTRSTGQNTGYWRRRRGLRTERNREAALRRFAIVPDEATIPPRGSGSTGYP